MAKLMDRYITTGFNYNGDEYILTSIEFPHKFFGIDDIYALGFKPEIFDTIFFYEYISTFAIIDNKLVLNGLYTNNGYKIENKVPLINNRLPKISSPRIRIDGTDNGWREFIYEDINLNIDYTGSIIIMKDFIKNKYSNFLQFPSLIHYNVVLQLAINNGNLINIKNLSDIASSAREGNFVDYEKYIMGWMDFGFDISYYKMVEL